MRKLFSKLNRACIGANRPTPSEQGNTHGRKACYSQKLIKDRKGYQQLGFINQTYSGEAWGIVEAKIFLW